MSEIFFTENRKPNCVDISFDFNGKEINFAEAKAYHGFWHLLIPDHFAKTTETEKFETKGLALDACAALIRDWIKENS